MSDDEGPKYTDGEIVWVKLGSCWWPGEVTENGPEDFTAKKPPLAIVKFFNEDTYEFVKTHNNIYPYNCERKNEFIKKGMDSFRGHNAHMEKFPGDVSLAEIRTDGNPNILSDPIFAPQKKTNVIAEVFGSPSPKKTPKDGKHKRSSTSKNSSKRQSKVNITHRRFLGCDDYEAHIRVQYPGKDAEHVSSDEEEITLLNKEPTQTFNCSQCTFNTTRLEVMLFHVQCHIKGITTPVQSKKKQVPKKKKSRVVHKHITSDDDRTHSSAGYVDTDSEEEKPKAKRKKRTPISPNKQPKPKVQKVEEEKTVADIRTNLLAEWSDSEDNEDMEPSKPDTSEESLNFEKDIVEEPEKEEEPKPEEQQKPIEKVEDQTSKDLKSCFDFDEDDEEEENIVQTTAGRKIPRVIPPSDKRKSTDNDDSSLPSIEDDELVKESENSNEHVPNVVDLAKQEEIFKTLMESTVVPDLPEVPDSSKPAQNFSESKPVKIPDKQKENISEVATKLTNPKKRFVKSFEDFELLQNEQRRAQEEREEELKKEKVTVETIEPIVETPVVETQVDPEPPVELPSQILEAPPESPPNVEPPVVQEEAQQEIVQEQTNESVEETVEIPPVEETFIEEPKFTETEDKITEPVITENDLEIETNKEETDEVFNKVDRNLQISKLKCQIMSKLSDELEEAESIKTSKSKTSHRSPRSKILESYRNDKNKEKARKSTEEKEETKKEHCSPKKSKYLRLSKDESENIEKIEEENSKDEPSKSEVMKQIEEIPEKNSDEEIGKINQIDEYFNDFLFNIPKKEESPKEEDVKNETKNEEIVEEKQPSNEIQITCAISDNDDNSTISIKTNLTNLNRDESEMSALSTLAMVSELETNIEKREEEEEEQVEEQVTEPIKEPRSEPELVPIDGNLTVVSEKDLADAQVEITAEASPTCKKPVTLTSFSMDFSESNSNSTTDSLTSDTIESKKEEVKKIPGPDDVFDIEEHIPSQIVDKPKLKEPSSQPSSKLLERLTESKSKDNSVQKYAKVPITKDSTKTPKTKMILKSSSGSNKLIKGTASQSNKPIILSEKIIKPVKAVVDPHASVSVQKITSKRNLQDADEIDAFIIQKGGSKSVEEDEETDSSITEDEIPVKKGRRSTAGMDPKKLQVSSSGTSVKKRGKAKILQQTIITPAGEIIQPNVTTKTTEPPTATVVAAPPPTTTSTVVTTVQDDNVFDINSMPIVLSDQILTPESIENMPILYTDTTVQTTAEPVTPTTTVAAISTISNKVPAVVKKTPVTIQSHTSMRVLNKSVASPATKLVKTPKIIGTVGSKLIKQNSFSSGSSKHGKYVIVTQSPSTSTVSKYTVGKNKPLVKRVTADLTMPTAGTLTKVQNVAPEPTGNKIMILTDDKGQQQRVLLTPAQQKMMGYQTQGAKLTKTIVKGNIIQKTKDGQMTAIPGSSGLISRAITPSSRINSNQTFISSSGHVLSQIHPQQAKTMRIEKSIGGRKIQMQSQKVSIKPPQQKTILIKNQHGQTVRKIQGTDDALLDKQVAEQIEAIKASGVLQQKQEMLNYKPSPKTMRRSYAKKIESVKPQVLQKTKNENVVPPLAPISPKKTEVVTTQAEGKQERALHQLVIQDAMGNQTTITEGQILALPSETVDGQPQSYMLVTLDESGNLTPLNNEALLSLDPNLGLGGDLGNTVLQIDQSALKETTPQVEVAKTEPVVTEPQQQPQPEQQEETPKEDDKPPETGEASEEQIVDSSVMQAMGESGQQLIVTGDPIAAQKFLESLTEGNSDLANILASAEGSSILIHADGQQILINTDSDNQMLLSVNTDNMTESSEGGGNPIFATQPAKNQDILAAALADTDVFQQEQNGAQGKAPQLSPNSALYPMNVGNVLETSLTLNSPIMTPLEVPSTNSKKISDESDILNQVPKNVDLPITITDPNISQTVSQQQVASLMVNELQSNLELSLPISEAAITVASTEMNSPSFVYSLPSLDAPDINQKPFNSSMPLLTEDSEEGSNEPKDQKPEESTIKTTPDEKEEPKTDSIKISPEGSFLDESEGLCTLGGEMCSSLSEPPPDMFDLSAVLSSHQMKAGSTSPKEDKSDGLVIMEDAELKIDDKGGDESASSESVNPDTASVTETSSPNTMNEDSCEIPVQPNIVTTLKEDGFGEETMGSKREGEELENDNNKKCKFDD